MYIQKNYLMHNSIRHIKYYRKRKEKNKENTFFLRSKKTRRILTTKERTKKHRERITKGQSPSPRPVEKGATERSKQLVVSAFHVLKRSPISLSPNTPHQAQQNQIPNAR